MVYHTISNNALIKRKVDLEVVAEETENYQVIVEEVAVAEGVKEVT